MIFVPSISLFAVYCCPFEHIEWDPSQVAYSFWVHIWWCGRAFGYSSEDVQMVIESMASTGKEPTFCMGDDIPLAVLSGKPHMLYDYFKQRFAQV